MPPGKIKCTYETCYRHFQTEEAMKKHKAKDPSHDYYCKKCDVDATNDMELLYHQITSEKHMACPICGREFKSESGRDRHVDIEHVPKQRLACAGCQIKFDRASNLMAHIEGDECEVIRLEHFSRQKAEKQISQDAWTAATDPTAGSTILSSARAYPTSSHEMNLLDDDRAYVNTDWQGRPQLDEFNEQNGPYVDPPTQQMANMSVSKFPPLGPQRIPTYGVPTVADDLPSTIDRDQGPTVHQPSNRGAWSNTGGSSHLFKNGSTTSHSPAAKPSQPTRPTPSTVSVNLLDSFTDDGLDPNTNNPDTSPPPSETTSHATWGTKSKPPTSTSALPPAARPENPDPNFPNASLKFRALPRDIPSSLSLDRLYDTTLDVYICPGTTCGRHYKTPELFNAHLIAADGPHALQPVRCPSCYKQFRTTTALIAHCESGSRKCRVRNAWDYDKVLREVTAGVLATDGYLDDGSVKYVAQNVEEW